MNYTFSYLVILFGFLSLFVRYSNNQKTFGSFFKFTKVSSTNNDLFSCDKNYDACIKIGTFDPDNLQTQALESLSVGNTLNNINYCDFLPCKNGGTCRKVDSENGYKCDCKIGYKGENCQNDPCNPSPCQNGATCTRVPSLPHGFSCACLTGFYGRSCERDGCNPTPCLNGGTCVRTDSNGANFICQCPSYTLGDHCERSPCSPNPCQHSGICQIDLNVCNPSPCYNRQKCVKKLATENANLYGCDCSRGFIGSSCELDACDNHNCSRVGGYCIRLDYPHFQCGCYDGFSGEICNHDKCESNPCQNGGVCSQTTKGYKCTCPQPFFGVNCEYEFCKQNPCKNNATCNRTSDEIGFKCSCPDGYFGRLCKNDSCGVNPCENNGTCMRKPEGKFNCSCLQGFYGDLCEKNICSPNPCSNNGRCTPTNGGFNCSCNNNTYGRLCEIGPIESVFQDKKAENLSKWLECPKNFTLKAIFTHKQNFSNNLNYTIQAVYNMGIACLTSTGKYLIKQFLPGVNQTSNSTLLSCNEEDSLKALKMSVNSDMITEILPHCGGDNDLGLYHIVKCEANKEVFAIQISFSKNYDNQSTRAINNLRFICR
ncbi:DgyrCDS2906 [Dimorphilus gyrociliatus]|uniref:DgyrCDS2906 n=1 Tax=Dimorphilus gyrociliatus TaxID=2664684 RepID=A0A7I8VGQ7_9ANNE|nr:DgyrCDS2906 [Dimorphilus gyrociliatus]